MKIQWATILCALEITYYLIILLGRNADMLSEYYFIYLLMVLLEKIFSYFGLLSVLQTCLMLTVNKLYKDHFNTNIKM